ncbi:MAG TPA: sigma-70 family RNA polymerase sigma factor [Gemmatimonadaceae bacterium]
MSDRNPTSAKLLAGIHDCDESAIREFFLLYAPLLRDQARQMGVDADDREEMVTTLLDDVVLHLMEHRLAPRDLARYVVAAFRNRARRHHRDLDRHDASRNAAYSALGGAQQQVVAECISEYTAGISAGHEDASPLRSVIANLARHLESELTPDEMRMIVAVGRHIPLRETANQLGISYGAARVRLHRLRERFRTIGSQYVTSLEPDEKCEIEKFFHRAQFTIRSAPTNPTAQLAKESQ